MTDVDAFLDDLDRLATTAPADRPAAFYRQLMPAAGMAIGAEQADLVSLIGEEPLSWAAESIEPRPAPGAERFASLRTERSPRVLTAPEDGAPVIACPVEGADTATGVLLFRLTPEAAASVEASLRLAAAIGEVAGRYELRRAAQRVGEAEKRLARVEETLVRLHSVRGAGRIAAQAAEEGRRLIDCDRLSLIARSGGGWRVLAVSGVRQLNRRSDAAKRMTALAAAAARWGEPIAAPIDPYDTPRDVVEAIDAHCDAAGVRSLRVRPCPSPLDEADPDSPDAVLLAEWFDSDYRGDSEALLAALARHVGVAMAREPGGLRAGSLLGRGALAALLAGALTLATLAAAFTPATLWLHVEGRFEPVDRARVFAPLDGVVDEVLVEQSRRVEVGQPLLRLRSPELRLQREEVAEAIAATKADLAALETAKLRAALPGVGDPDDDPTALASRVASLREKLTYQQARRDLLALQAERLVVTSPIGGEVLSWRPQDLLSDRPVERGQRLLEIAGGERWRLELETPDHRSGPLLNARAEGSPLRVEYVVRADPAETHTATVESIEPATRVSAEGLPVVRVVAAPDDAQAPNPRSGLGVSAKIDCGEHSLGYVWLHEAIAAVRRWWF
ncbi:hypothetical protein MalM25_09190 [Planctomycetes bacterium MalM25]|nr:hypothetical protein MalM25_09190 [Planctomycetes bacterium MalM25]